MSVPNQKRVIIGKRVKRNKSHLYAMMNIEALQEAIQNLKWSSLKMWLYFNKNQDNYQFDLSVKACKDWGIKKDSYYSGIAELIAKGYLVPIQEGSNVYVFFESANSEKQMSDYSKFTIQDWENQNGSSETQIKQSENLERNNIDNTYIVQNNTMATDNEIKMLKDLKTMYILGFYQGSEVDWAKKLLEKYSQYSAPKDIIVQMSFNERRELQKVWTEYNKTKTEGEYYYG